MTRRRTFVILWLLVALYAVHFAVLSVLQNEAFETAAADLGNMNQAAWYTLHHGYPADSYAGIVIPRLGGHVEPVFYLLVPLYALHQTANTLLVLQATIVALGAVAVYMLARDVLGSDGAGLVFALVYLLFPSLQAAVLTEFHPVALAAPLFLFAFYYLQAYRYRPFLLFTLLAMSVKEDMSLLAAMLGFFVMVGGRPVQPSLVVRRCIAAWVTRGVPGRDESPSHKPSPGYGGRFPTGAERVRVGGALLLTSLIWFLLTVYVIIPHVSPSGDVVVFQRYAEVGGSPHGLLRTLLSNPMVILERLVAEEKLSYLGGLLLSAGFLTLGAPWALVLAGPSLAINMLSNYPAMYSGLSHYSAPVVPFIVIGSIYGARFHSGVVQRLLHWPAHYALTLVLAWLVAAALIYQGLVGFTPLSLLYRVPLVTEHHRLLSRFTRQIPAEAVVSAQPALHPHISSRSFAYPFPVVNDAEYVLLDVTAKPTMHPNDLKAAVHSMLQDGFGILDAADGYILLKRGLRTVDLPESFYTAFRARDAQPRYRACVDFGPLRLLGYDIEDVDEGRQPWTRLRLYWQVTAPVPASVRLYPFYLDDEGRVIEDTTQRPLVATLWYPPERWQVGDILRVETLPWPVGNRFRVAVGVVQGSDWGNRSARLPVHLVDTSIPLRRLDGGSAVELGRFRRRATQLVPTQPPVPGPALRLDATFGDEITLLGYDMRRDGSQVDITLYWQAVKRPHVDYHTFVHAYDGAGRLVAQSDGVTGDEHPTSWWFPGQTVAETRRITVPQPGATVHIGLYRLDTGARLPVTVAGAAQGDAVHVSME